jgi:hypothetical protein
LSCGLRCTRIEPGDVVASLTGDASDVAALDEQDSASGGE